MIIISLGVQRCSEMLAPSHLSVQSETILEEEDGDGLPPQGSGRAARKADLGAATEAVQFVDSSANEVKVRLLAMAGSRRRRGVSFFAVADASSDVATHGRGVPAKIGCRKEGEANVLVHLVHTESVEQKGGLMARLSSLVHATWVQPLDLSFYVCGAQEYCTYR